MKKVLLVVQREYFTRVKKKSFWFMTILIPILMATLYAIPIYLSINSFEKTKVMVVDETQLFHSFHSNNEIQYSYKLDIKTAQSELKNNDTYTAIVYIPKTEGRIPSDAYLYYNSDVPGISVKSDIDAQIQKMLKNNILLEVHNISKEDYNVINSTTIQLHTQDLQTGRTDFIEIKTVIGFALAFLIYIVIFMFGSQVMRGVIEEKTNRIIEVMISSIRPFQLMMGKVIGIALVGLTQFLLWIVLSFGAFTVIQISNADIFARLDNEQTVASIATKGTSVVEQINQPMDKLPELMQGLFSINFDVIIGLFLFYFILGYLLYATLFAAVGSVTENETDSQQFILPITIPLLLALLLTPSVLNAPGGSLAVWLSIIPFTSPISMMVRIPFGIPIWQIWVSIGALLVTFIGCTWVAAKIYRTGILMYGKKITYKELWKWLKYKN